MTGDYLESFVDDLRIRERRKQELCKLVTPTDSNVETVREELLNRSKTGFTKYGTTTERTDIDLIGWVQHLKEELLDAAVYCERIKQELNGNDT